MKDELLDLVDDRDRVIGTILRSDSGTLLQDGRGYIRAVDMFIQNDVGKLWIPTRTVHKQIAPGGLDFSMGGHVESGETYDQTLIRETQEELNLDIDLDKIILVKKFPPAETPYFRCVYLYSANDTPIFNPDDFVSAEWLSPEELLAKLDAGAPAKTSLRPTVAKLFQV